MGTNKPPSLKDINIISEKRKIATCYKSTYDKILLMGDFNMTPSNPNIVDLIRDYELQN